MLIDQFRRSNSRFSRCVVYSPSAGSSMFLRSTRNCFTSSNCCLSLSVTCGPFIRNVNPQPSPRSKYLALTVPGRLSQPKRRDRPNPGLPQDAIEVSLSNQVEIPAAERRTVELDLVGMQVVPNRGNSDKTHGATL